MTTFRLTLQKTYHDKGSFNVAVDCERFVRKTAGPVHLQLGTGRPFIQATVNRTANAKGTARIMGGVALRDWFFKNFEPMDVVSVDLTSMNVTILKSAYGAGGEDSVWPGAEKLPSVKRLLDEINTKLRHRRRLR